MTTPPDPLWAALGRIPSGLFVLTCTHAGQETGMLASWVQQCSFTPPQVAVAVRKGRPVLGWLTEGNARLVVNVLPEGPKRFVAHFGKGFDPGEPAFEGLDVDRTRAAAPVLLDAVAYLDCRVSSATDAADHVLFVMEVIGGAVLGEAKPATHTRKTGTHY